MQKGKMLFQDALQIVEKRREAKGKGEKERYTHLNAGFQRIARRDKKAFLGDQCKEIEENNRIGKNRGLFKNIQKKCTKKLLMTQITMIVWSLTKSKTPWSVTSSRP